MSDLNSHDWAEYISPPMSKVETDEFQDQLDALVGVESDGAKRLLLGWIPSFEIWNQYLGRYLPAVLWKALPDGLEQREGSVILQKKYRFVGVPRYALFGLIPEDQRPSAELRKAGSDADGTPYAEDRNQRQYQRLLTIWEHDPRVVEGHNVCCIERAQKYRNKCFGKYRAPDAGDIQWLKEQLALWALSYQTIAHRPLSPEDKDQVLRFWMDAESADRKAKADEAAYIHNSLRNDPWIARDRKFSLPGANN